MQRVVEGPEASALRDELADVVGREDPYPRYERLRQIAAVLRAEDSLTIKGFVRLPVDPG